MLWGETLTEEFHGIYSKKSRYVLMLISEKYLEKMWCRHERRSAMAEALRREKAFILPVKFDTSWPDGMPHDIGYVDANKKAPADIAALIAKKLGVNILAVKASKVPASRSSSWAGQVSIDPESHNGHHFIGDDYYSFETRWSAVGDGIIAAYNYGENVNGIAVAQGVGNFREIDDAASLDFTSNQRIVRDGEILVIRNNAGIYAALRMVSITLRRGKVPANLTFDYLIFRDGSSNFSAMDTI